MNKVDFSKYQKFPLSTESLDFMQQMTMMMSNVALMAGDNYILSGCVETGNNVSAGIIVINGEVIPFVGGTKEAYIVIEETKRTVTAAGQIYEDIYVSRNARFGTGVVQFEWSGFKPVTPIPKIVPRGVIVMWSGTTAPDGWHICDGEDGTPNLTGKFVVGQCFQDADFIDIGAVGGAKRVSLTLEQMPVHNHTYTAPLIDGDHPGGSSGYNRPNGKNQGITGSAGESQTHENLPPYYVLAYIMKI